MRRAASFAIAAAAACALAVVPAVPASAATDVLTVGSVGGTNAAPGDGIDMPLAAGTVATFGSVTCTGADLGATVTGNPPAPGTAKLSISTATIGGCTGGPPGTHGVAVALGNLPISMSIASSGTVTVISPRVALTFSTSIGTITCVYSASSVTGMFSNADSSITFTNVQIPKASGPSLCQPTLSVTVKFAPVTDTTQGGQRVFVN